MKEVGLKEFSKNWNALLQVITAASKQYCIYHDNLKCKYVLLSKYFNRDPCWRK